MNKLSQRRVRVMWSFLGVINSLASYVWVPYSIGLEEYGLLCCGHISACVPFLVGGNLYIWLTTAFPENFCLRPPKTTILSCIGIGTGVDFSTCCVFLWSYVWYAIYRRFLRSSANIWLPLEYTKTYGKCSTLTDFNARIWKLLVFN